MHTFSEISAILKCKPIQQVSDAVIEYLLTDSRKLLFPSQSLFFALNNPNKSANRFIKGLYEKGVRNFIVDESFEQSWLGSLPEANVILIPDVLEALQRIASSHRHLYHYPVIGITGSNGKTIVKEWLYQLLSEKFNVAHSPKSYNSQVGVPLSVWQMNSAHDLAIFEAGISQPGEMEKLQKVIDPEIGVVTYIGEAHAEGFTNKEQKVDEKLLLFTNSRLLVYNSDDDLLHSRINIFVKDSNPELKLISWGKKNADVIVNEIRKEGENNTFIQVRFQKQDLSFQIPFSDEAHIHNAITCLTILLALDLSPTDITGWMPHLKPVEMRMELKQGINNCSIINDSYSADLNSLTIALDFLEQQQQHEKRAVILSDFLQSGLDDKTLYNKIASILFQKNIFRFIGIGPQISRQSGSFSKFKNSHFFSSTESFLEAIPEMRFSSETILVKGARVFRFEKINHALQQKLHETVLEIDLNAMRHNYNFYRKLLKRETKVMVMVKAFGYGSGTFEVANLLRYSGADYLAVAYADEGVELRKAGIDLPIMVMNTEEAGFEMIVKYELEPEIYSFGILNAFTAFLQQHNRKGYPAHIKIDTGMHRLGFITSEVAELCKALKENQFIRIRSVFSHLAASDDTAHDTFTELQARLLLEATSTLEAALGYSFLKHIGNTGAIHRHNHLQMDMVRLGIGLYGIDNNPQVQRQLQNVTTLKTTISQLKMVKKGESVGYSRRGMVDKDSNIAIVQIGYADGYPRSFGNGIGKMLVNGLLAPVIGNVCMDMTMLDLSGIDANEGDEVIVFGESLPVSLVAEWASTIPYEILTGVSQRVRRVYFEQ